MLGLDLFNLARRIQPLAGPPCVAVALPSQRHEHADVIHLDSHAEVLGTDGFELRLCRREASDIHVEVLEEGCRITAAHGVVLDVLVQVMADLVAA
jgi:hypothetical protein